MNPRPDDRQIDRLLAGLPRQAASPGFAGRVVAALEESARPRRSRSWLLAGVLATVLAAAGLWLTPRAPSPRDRPDDLRQADTGLMLEEHRRLTEELESLKTRLRATEPPLLYLGGDEGLDLVLDLTPVLQPAAAGARRGGIRPAEPSSPLPASRQPSNGGI